MKRSPAARVGGGNHVSPACPLLLESVGNLPVPHTPPRSWAGGRPMNLERGVPLARLTTIGTGGPATALARPRSLTELEEALRFAEAEGLDVVVVGLGSNLLAADEGVDALVLRLQGQLAAVAVDDSTIQAGGG